MTRITARVPATSANLGPGFDCFGLALELRTEVTLLLGEPFSIKVEGEGAHRIARDERNLVYRGVRAFYERIQRPMPTLALEIRSRIPQTGGLGSSSAGLIGGLVAANVAAGRPMDVDAVLALATEIEGHPDNVAPALLGGFVLVLGDSDSRQIAVSLPVPPELSAVVFVPSFAMPTKRMRALLPPVVPRADALFNIGRTALWVAALQTGRLDLLRIATEDRLHQPYRAKVFPALPTVIEAALAAGAFGACLSGAGSAVLALATSRQSQIGQAMKEAALGRGVQGRWIAIDLARSGADVFEEV